MSDIWNPKASSLEKKMTKLIIAIPELPIFFRIFINSNMSFKMKMSGWKKNKYFVTRLIE